MTCVLLLRRSCDVCVTAEEVIMDTLVYHP